MVNLLVVAMTDFSDTSHHHLAGALFIGSTLNDSYQDILNNNDPISTEPELPTYVEPPVLERRPILTAIKLHRLS